MKAQAQIPQGNKQATSLVPTGLLQGKKGPTGMKEESRRKRQVLQRSAVNNDELSEVPPIVNEVLRSPGQPLDKKTRAFMENRFGHDLSNVRIHTDVRARQSAHVINARAYTVGEHVVFASGFYQPDTEHGRVLLAHELAHTIQQEGLPAEGGSFAAEAVAGPYEVAARMASARVSSGCTVPALARIARPTILCEDGDVTYNLRLTDPPFYTTQHERLTLVEAQVVLHRFADRIHGHIEGGYEGHRALSRIREEQYIVGSISDFLGGVSMPPLSMWEEPRRQVRQARAVVERGDIVTAARVLQRAAFDTRRAARRVYEYREGTIGGAEVAVTGLEAVQVASAAVVTVGTGGTAGVVVGAGYVGAQRLAGEATSVHIGLQDRIDWGGVAFDTLFSLVVGRFGGQLGRAIAARLGGRIAAQAVSALIVGRASGMTHAVARELFDGLRGRTELSIEGFINRLAQQLTLQAAFLDLVGVAAGIGTARLRAGGAPTPPRPGRAGGERPLRLVQTLPETEAGSRRTAPPRGRGTVTDIGQYRDRIAAAARQASRVPAPEFAPQPRQGARGIVAPNLAGEPAQVPVEQPLLRLVPPPEVEPLPSPVALVQPRATASPGTGQQPSNVPSAVAIAAVAIAAAAGPTSTSSLQCGSPTGLTPADPIPFIWYKVPENDYYPSPILLDRTEYYRDNPTNLPRGEPIGVPAQYWPRPRKLLQLSPETRGPNAARFRAVLESYGFDWVGRRWLQADHVQDLQWASPDGANLDTFANLWPMDGAANMSAGPRQNNNQQVTFCETSRGPLRTMTLLEMKTAGRAGAPYFGRYFSIRSVQR
jgi:hypothetical protein